MIEHRLYYIEDEDCYLNLMLICTPERAMLYKLQGYVVCDFTKDLGRDPYYFQEETEQILFDTLRGTQND